MVTPETVGAWNGARREMEDDGWHLARTLRGGTKAMRKARERYTPMTDAERRRPAHYEKRLLRSTLYPMFSDRVRSISSLPFQREPTIDGEPPEIVTKIMANADRCGTSAASFWKRIYHDAIERGMGMVLVDNVPFTERPLPQVDELDARPYLIRIAPDNLVGFQTETIHGRDKVTEFRYREWAWRPGATGDVLVDRVRVWSTTEVQVWERDLSLTVLDREIEASKINAGITYRLMSSRPHEFPDGIPLVVVYTEKVDTLQARPALEDLAWINVAHWQSESAQRDALAYCRAPILRIAGASHETAKSRPDVSPGATIVDTSPDLEMGFVEIAGPSLAAGQVDIDSLRMQGEALGMRPMISVGGPETATGEVRADVSEKSEAQSWVESLEWAIYQGFELAAKWQGETLPDDFDITLFKDSSLIAGKATDLPVLQSMATSKFISHRTYLAEVKARGVLVTVDDIDEEVAAVEEEAQAGLERQMETMAASMIAERPGAGEDDERGADPEDGEGSKMPPQFAGAP